MLLRKLMKRYAGLAFAGLVGIGAALGVQTAEAQTNYGTVVGTVTDTTGAQIPGAQVTLKSNGTNAVQTTKSGGGGTFSFFNLNPGVYTVTVSNAGFKAFTQTQIDVTIGGTARVDAALAAGDVTQTVTVEAASAALQTDNVSLGGVIEGRQVVEAPLNGRNVLNLLDFVPGVTPGGGTQGSTVANGGSGNFQAGGQTQAIAYGNYQIGGGFSGQSLFYIDGVAQNVPENNVNSLVPTQDAVQEFRVSTNNVSAEFGGYGGGVIEISSKSGTNKYHGNAYEYLRNTALDANDWFSNYNHLGKSPLHQNQYGANFSGPLLRDKAFFFFSFERESLLSSAPTSTIFPTTAELGGDFSVGADANRIIYDPLTGQPFAGNMIPADRIDQTALKILTLEIPNEATVNQTPLGQTAASAPIEGYQNQFNARVDYNLGKTDQIFARYTFWNPHNGKSDPYGTNTGSGTTGNTTTEAVLGDTHIFNPSTTAEVRASYLQNYNFQNVLSAGFDLSSINPAYGSVQSQTGAVGFLPGLGIEGYGVGPNLSQLYWLNTVYGLSGSVSKVVGRHTVKAGGNWRQVLWTSFGNSGGIGLNSNHFFTAATPTDQNSGNGLASFLLGIPSSTSDGSILTQHSFLHNYSFYVTDTFQATRKLTVNAGIRWEQPGSYTEENDLNTVLQPNAAATVGNLSSIINPVSGASQPLTARLALVNSPEYKSRREEALHYNLFSPRVGLAYRLDEKTVLRSAYGISYLPAEITQDGPQLSQVSRASTSVTNTPGQPLLATVANPLPNGVTPPLGHSQAALDAQIGNGLWARVPNQKYGYVQQWNLAVERAIDHKSTLEVAYAGAKGTGLVGASAYTASGLNLNQLPNQYDSLGTDLLTQVENPFYGNVRAGTPISGPTVAKGYLLLPHPQYPNGVLQQVPRFGSSSYHALQMTFIRRFSHQGTLQAAYTWSKLLSSVDNTSEFEDGQGASAVPQDNYNLRAEKSLSEQDLANNLVVNYGIDLPYGHGQSYGAHSNGFTNAVLGGWRVNGITILKSGLPLALTANSNALGQFGIGTSYFGPGGSIIRPTQIAGCNRNAPGSPHSIARVNQWFNTACYAPAPDFGFGNEARVDPLLKSQGGINFDASINKSFDVTELVKVKFTGEFFDLFNHTQFAAPGSTQGTGSFGVVNHQSNLPRTIQLALRVSF